MKKLRLFIAIGLPLQIRNGIYEALEMLRQKYPGISWVDKEKIHITLKYLGTLSNKLENTNTVESSIEKIKNEAAKSIESIKKFNLKIGEFGYFYNYNLIFYATIRPSKELIILEKKLQKSMEQIGYKKKKRSFYPHVTLGRSKKGNMKELLSDIEEIKLSTLLEFEVSGVVLINSRLSPEGSRYERLANFSFS